MYANVHGFNQVPPLIELAAAIQTDNKDTQNIDNKTNEAASRASAVYANLRGFNQAAQEVVIYVHNKKPHFAFINETHLNADEPINRLMPTGYKVVSRLDRTANGGGLMIWSRSDLLCDLLDMKEYNTVETSELIAMKHESITHMLGYTNKSSCAHVLIAAVTQYLLDHPDEKIALYGDFNVHNKDWIHSTKTDSGGVLAQEFAELFGLQQAVNFPRRKGNTLDLILSNIDLSAAEMILFGTSDHKSIKIELQVQREIPQVEEQPCIMQWRTAPWKHINGYLKRKFKVWTIDK